MINIEENLVEILEKYEPVGLPIEYEDLSYKIQDVFEEYEMSSIDELSDIIYNLLCDEYGEENLGLIEDYEDMFKQLWNLYISS